MSVDEESYEEHVLQNNQRLLSIAATLREPAQFAAACSELTQWCSDPRAYTPHFEDNLVGALQISVENGTKDGFDFTLAHQLITCCFQHRKLLSKESAVRINRWYEQYRRIKKNGGKRKRKSEMPPVDPGGLEQITVTDSGCTSSMWPQGAPMAGTTPMTSPGYHQQMMMGPGGYPQQGPFPPMDPTGARPPGYPEGSYDQQAAMMQQMMFRQRAAQQQQAAAARRGAAPQGYDPAMYPIPMGANNVPGQTQPLLRMPSQPGPGYPPMMGAGGRGGLLMSPGYPQGNSHQMIKASPPVLFSNLQQQQPQSQPVMSYPNPHAMPPPYQQEMQMVCVPWAGHLVNPFSPPDGMHQYQTTFSVTPDMYVQLSQSHQLNLLLKSHSGQDETGTQRTCWPVRPGTNEPAVQISINGNVVPVTKDRSTMVKAFVKQGENKLEIQCMPMPYKHYYMIQPVHIMPLSRFTEELFTRQQRSQHTSDHFKTKLLNKGNNSTVVISLLDGRTGKRLKYPARSQKCQHIAAFELGDVVMSQSECNQLLCPVQGCNTNFQLAEIELDLFLGDVIRHVVANNIQASEAILEPNGCYRLSDGSDSTASTAATRKRSATTNDDANSHSLKRIKSEQFPQQNSGASPFPSVHSLPGSMLSPFGNNVSPKKEIMSPPVGSGTPQPQKDESQPLPGASTLTSPPGVPVVNNGSVDSANGSAPYTPASMNGTSTSHVAPQQVEAHHNSLSNLENLDILEPFRPDMFGVHSPIEIEKYLQDGDLMSGCHKYELSDQTLIDLVDILNQDAKKTWGVDLKTIELQLTPLIMKN